jgi:hypothetical protein
MYDFLKISVVVEDSTYHANSLSNIMAKRMPIKAIKDIVSEKKIQLGATLKKLIPTSSDVGVKWRSGST